MTLSDHHPARFSQKPPSTPAQLVAVSAVATSLLAITYFTMVRTSIGQAWGDEAYLGRLEEGVPLNTLDKLILGSIDVRVIAGFGLAVVVVAALRRLWIPGLILISGFAAAMASAELLKSVLPRPELAPEFESLMGNKEALNTFPSGHTTLATCFALSLILLSSPRVRPFVALGGGAFAAFVASGVVAAGWHRPSDAAGGVGLALVSMCLASALCIHLPTSDAIKVRSSLGNDRRLIVGASCVLTIGVCVLAFALLRGNASKVPAGVGVWEFPAAEVLLDVLALAAVVSYTLIVRGVEFSHRRGARRLGEGIPTNSGLVTG